MEFYNVWTVVSHSIFYMCIDRCSLYCWYLPWVVVALRGESAEDIFLQPRFASVSRTAILPHPPLWS